MTSRHSQLLCQTTCRSEAERLIALSTPLVTIFLSSASSRSHVCIEILSAASTADRFRPGVVFAVLQHSGLLVPCCSSLSGHLHAFFCRSYPLGKGWSRLNLVPWKGLCAGLGQPLQRTRHLPSGVCVLISLSPTFAAT